MAELPSRFAQNLPWVDNVSQTLELWMQNSITFTARDIGIELLRTLIVLHEERSYTKAASRLGLSQPTISSHIKRLQQQLGAEILDKSIPGFNLNANGERALSYARQILSLNGSLYHDIHHNEQLSNRIRLGLNTTYGLNKLFPALAKFHAADANLTFEMHRASNSALLKSFRAGELDLCMALSQNPPHDDALCYWRHELVWVAATDYQRPVRMPVELVSRSESSIAIQIMMAALLQAKIEFHVAMNAEDIDDAIEAVRCGIGVTCLTRGYDAPPDLVMLGPEDGMPKLGNIYCGIYVNRSTRTARLEQLARTLASAFAGEAIDGVTVPADDSADER